jgi:site-specific recombinase XerD
VLTPAEVAALMAACGETATGVRNRALIAVLYRSGLRVSEALGLFEKDIDFDRCAIRVLFAKGGRSRTVGIDPGGLAHVRAWLDRRSACGLDATHPVFCIVQGPDWGDALDTGYVRLTFKRLAAKASLAKRVHPHGLRHTHAAELRQEGFDIGIISKQLGHRDISTTARYLDHVAPWAVVEAVRRRAG